MYAYICIASCRVIPRHFTSILGTCLPAYRPACPACPPSGLPTRLPACPPARPPACLHARIPSCRPPTYRHTSPDTHPLACLPDQPAAHPAASCTPAGPSTRPPARLLACPSARLPTCHRTRNHGATVAMFMPIKDLCEHKTNADAIRSTSEPTPHATQ